MHLDPALPTVVAVVFVLIAVASISRIVRQPYVVAYIVAGILLGPAGLGLVSDPEVVGRFGAIGVVLLLFFIGMEISADRLAASWRIALVGTTLQVAITTGLVVGLGQLAGWSIPLSVLIGFVVSLSSTAVVLKLLEDWGEVATPTGRDVIAILLTQDLAVIPMLLAVGFLGGQALDEKTLRLQVVGAVLFGALAVWIGTGRPIRLPFGQWLRDDRELQVLSALAICFGLATLSGALELSTALGAFVAGMVVHTARETDWVEEGLNGFRVVFIALFFVSVGLLMDLAFIEAHWPEVLMLVFVAVVAKTFINAGILKLLGRSWADSLYAGALLSQIGEFSFVIAAVGSQSGLISGFGHQMTVSVIAVSLILSPGWIAATKGFIRRKLTAVACAGEAGSDA